MKIKNPTIRNMDKVTKDEMETMTITYKCCNVPKSVIVNEPFTTDIPDDLGTLKYRTIVNIKGIIETEELSIDTVARVLALFLDCEVDHVKDLRMNEALPLFFFIIDELERLDKLESKLLTYIPTAEEEKAGIERFAKFGEFGRELGLAGGDPTKLEQVRDLEYNTVLATLVYRKEESEYQRDYAEVMKR